MNIIRAKIINFKPNLHAIIRNFDAFDSTFLRIYRRAAIYCVVFIDIAFNSIRSNIFCRFFIYRLGKFYFKSIGHSSYGPHFKRNFVIPYQTLQPHAGIAGRTPSTVGFANKKRTIFAPIHAYRSRLKTGFKFPGYTLVLTIYLFHKYPAEVAFALVAH